MTEDEYIKQRLLELERQDKIVHAFVPDHLDSRPSEVQAVPLKALAHSIKYSYVAGGNQSAKSSILLRNLVWAAEETHPYWERPSSYKCNNKLCGNEMTQLLSTEAETHVGIFRYHCHKCNNTWRKWDENEPLCFILSGQQLKNIQENLYTPRIKKLFQYPDDWKEDKLGSPFIQKVTNKNTGNTIIFFPHGHGEEQARKATQGYTVHGIFMDEQAPVAVMEELQRRVDARYGTFMSAFTMKRRDPAMTRFMEAQVKAGAARIFKIAQFDNPLYAGMRDVILARVSGLSEGKRNAILYGELDESEESSLVFNPDPDLLRKPLPGNYNTRSWKHVEVIDPAIQSIAGRLVCAQNPETKKWWVIKAQYLKGMKHDMHLCDELIKLREKEGFNFVHFVSDDSANFRGAAANHYRSPIHYAVPPSKRSKKLEGKKFLINQTRYYLDYEHLYIPEEFHLLWDELYSYEFKEGGEQIKNSHRFHLLDCLMYFFDALPPEDKLLEEVKSYHQEILDYNYYGIIPKDILARREGEINNKLQEKKKVYIIVPNSQIDKVLGKPKWRW
jgi:hypothetical protein